LSGDAGYAVYIMASRRNGTLYVGVTNDIARRAYEHRNGLGAAFTRKYGVTQLVWCEHYADINEARAKSSSRNGNAAGSSN
jgi:putative endonuclease